MAYSCDICAKGKQYGHNVPFSQKKTNKVWKPNLQRKYIELGGTRVQIKICTQCIRTLNKYRKQDAVAAAPVADAPAAKKPAAKKPAARKTAAKA